ncbi:MAG: photosynthetic reaction center subunit H [Alphaproteobacteria bacterium]|nr:photosynthetic reaction center subunit H [Alphaproteobacteria bacterium]
MEVGAITGYIDVAQVTLYVFWIFFFGLIIYLVQENKREGYPLHTDSLDPAGRREIAGLTGLPKPKTFTMLDGSTFQAPNPANADMRTLNATHGGRESTGFPIDPTGDPLLAGVGPGSWTERADVPDMGLDGRPKIIPMRLDEAFHVDEDDADPRGMPVIGADGETGGTITDIWIDPGEHLIRFLEADVGGGKTALIPMNLAKVEGGRGCVTVRAITGAQFANIPALAKPDQVTRLEEEKIYGYFGAGTLYAIPGRADPII